MSKDSLNEETKEFLKSISVELKNSLTTLLGLNYLEEQNIKDPEKLEELLAKSKDGLSYLLTVSDKVTELYEGKTTKPLESSNPAETESRKKKKEDINILIADDNELLAEVLLEIIEEAGYKGDIANDGDEAVNMFASSPVGKYSLIFMDVQMPNKNGLEATKEIRALNRRDSRKIPILAFTASDSEEDKQAAFASGMNDFITKPVNGDILLEKIKAHL